MNDRLSILAGIGNDPDVYVALLWLGSTLENNRLFFSRMFNAQQHYIKETSKTDNFGKRFDPTWYSPDIVAGFFSQALSFINCARCYEVSIASQIIPWVKLLGLHVEKLKDIPGASERARRMLESDKVHPDTAVFELVLAGNYAAQGYFVEFIPEKKGISKTPEFKCTDENGSSFYVECKKLQKCAYAIREEKEHKIQSRKIEDYIHSQKMSVWIDASYNQEINFVPEDYLFNHLSKYTGDIYKWHDEYGSGSIRYVDLNEIKSDIENNGSLLINTKLARLLKGSLLQDESFDIFVSGEYDERDPRFISSIDYASLLTWRCLSQKSLEARSRHVKKTLSEIDDQILEYGLGVGHIAIDVDVQKNVADKRRKKNTEEVKKFKLDSALVRLNIHYLLPRVSEKKSWVVDETVDYFCTDEMAYEAIPGVDIFPKETIFDNDLPAWYQKP